MSELDRALAQTAGAVEALLDSLLPMPEGREGRVVEAMRYSTLAGGKRVRPFLVVACADLFGVPRMQSLRTAAAVEMVHTYSLVHDDLPCMDDDALRRGLPTAHVRFDEATAVLAGDALLTRAFEVLGEPATCPDPAVRVDLVVALARAAGAAGMVGGQTIDLQLEHASAGLAAVERLQALKTGALIGFSCEAGAILGAATAADRAALQDYAADLGLAFQIADDLLDAEGDAAVLGKAAGKDAGRGKATFVALLGADGARARAAELAERAAARLAVFGRGAQVLRALPAFVITRRT